MDAKYNMLQSQLRANNIDGDLLAAFTEVDRVNFVPDNCKSFAYIDGSLPLPGGSSMLTPLLTARMIQLLDVSKNDRVMVIGVGSGYSLALLSKLSSYVVGYEIDSINYQFACSNLKEIGINCHLADGLAATNNYSIFNKILITGSMPYISDDMLLNLPHGSKLVSVVGDLPVMHLTVYNKHADGDTYSSHVVCETCTDRMIGAFQQVFNL